MKQFKNPEEAFQYQTHCPLCNEPIEADYKEISYDPSGLKTVVTFNVGSDDLTIDYHTNEIVSHVETRDLWNYRNNPAAGNYHIMKAGLIGKGTEIFKVTASCGKCGKYGYVLQMHVRLDERKLVGIFLNSESVSIEEGEVLHEIKNIYATDKTEYDKFTRVEVHNDTMDMSGWSGRRNGTVTFPLMPLDVKHPQILLSRIKNLIIYT